MELMKTIYDCTTKETITVPFTAEEIAEFELANQEALAQQQAQEAAEAQKAADAQAGRDALKALGLTDAQIDALVG